MIPVNKDLFFPLPSTGSLDKNSFKSVFSLSTEDQYTYPWFPGVYVLCFHHMLQDDDPNEIRDTFKALYNIGVTKETVVDVRRDQEGGTDASKAQKLG